MAETILATLEDLEEALDGGMSAPELAQAWETERDKKNRKGALEMLGDELLKIIDQGGPEGLQDELDEALQEIAALKEKLKSAAKEAQEAAKVEKEAPAPQLTSGASVTSMFSGDSVFVVAPLHEVERWQAMSKITRYVVDVSGDQAESLCRQYPHPVQVLVDGTIRIDTPSVRVARVLENKIRNAALTRDLQDVRIRVHSLGSSASIVTDAVRGKNVAVIREMCIVSGRRLTVAHSGDDLKLSAS